jgi:endogenous inhibitor of DNA gyrase (YacG/DUF329 family)
MTCPTCKKSSTEQYRPFCSKRCADVDLGRWFSGSYAIAAQETDEEDSQLLDEPPVEEDDSNH